MEGDKRKIIYYLNLPEGTGKSLFISHNKVKNLKFEK